MSLGPCAAGFAVRGSCAVQSKALGGSVSTAPATRFSAGWAVHSSAGILVLRPVARVGEFCGVWWMLIHSWGVLVHSIAVLVFADGIGA